MTEKATFAMGCFWGPDDFFHKVPGVLNTTAGYTGGTKENPTYEEVCAGNTGHAEAVEITFDPEKISYNQLLDLFWKNHNPTTHDRQGSDVGAQYRSAIFFHSPEQEQIARASKEKLEKNDKWGEPRPWEPAKRASGARPFEDFSEQGEGKSPKGVPRPSGEPIVTEIVPAGKFWRAEEYHQQYFAKNGIAGACHF